MSNSPFLPLAGFVDRVEPAQTQRMAELEARCWQWANALGFAPIQLPVVESQALFERAVGAGTDVVDKEMFVLRSEEARVLRPEGTSGAMRAWLNRGGRRTGPVRWAYCGPMFRNERQQAGRYRQFQQFGLEAIGGSAAAASLLDAELLVAMNDLFEALGVRDQLVLRLNSLGTPQERAVYRAVFQDFLRQNRGALDETSQARMETNPLRVWDSKLAKTQQALLRAPTIFECLGSQSLDDWARLQSDLQALGVAFVVDPGLMRGLDYYNATVFEWTTLESKAQNAVAAGGRYDGLAQQLGGEASCAFGLAMGLERVLALMPERAVERAGVFVAWSGSSAVRQQALTYARALRLGEAKVSLGAGGPGSCASLFSAPIWLDESGGKWAKQLSRANALNAAAVALFGPDELERGVVTLKDLNRGEQWCEPWPALS